MERNLVWSRLDTQGMEHLYLSENQHGSTANGLVLLIEEDIPYRIQYTVHCDASWHVREVHVVLLDTNTPAIHLRADGKGHWTTDANEKLPSLDGCIDVDISVTPFTNTVAIQRLQLTVEEVAEITVTYINVPTMQLSAVKQLYTCLASDENGGSYQYAGYPSGYHAELAVDRDKLVIAYPELFMRVWSSDK